MKGLKDLLTMKSCVDYGYMLAQVCTYIYIQVYEGGGEHCSESHKSPLKLNASGMIKQVRQYFPIDIDHVRGTCTHIGMW